MSRSLALALLLAVPAAARADMALPPFKPVRHQHLLRLDREYPEYEFFLVSGKWAEPIPPGETVTVPEWAIGFYARPEQRDPCVVAVQRVALAGVKLVTQDAKEANSDRTRPTLHVRVGDQMVLFTDWLLEHERESIWSDPLTFRHREDLGYWDTRSVVETTYRVAVEFGQIRVVPVSENAGSPWVKAGWVVAGILIPIGIIWFGWWASRPGPDSRNPSCIRGCGAIALGLVAIITLLCGLAGFIG